MCMTILIRIFASLTECMQKDYGHIKKLVFPYGQRISSPNRQLMQYMILEIIQKNLSEILWKQKKQL